MLSTGKLIGVTQQLLRVSSSDDMSGQQEGWERETRNGGRDRREPGWVAKPFSNLVETPDTKRESPYSTADGETQHLERPSSV